jgi:hypothetical protein
VGVDSPYRCHCHQEINIPVELAIEAILSSLIRIDLLVCLHIDRILAGLVVVDQLGSGGIDGLLFFLVGIDLLVSLQIDRVLSGLVVIDQLGSGSVDSLLLLLVGIDLVGNARVDSSLFLLIPGNQSLQSGNLRSGVRNDLVDLGLDGDVALLETDDPSVLFLEEFVQLVRSLMAEVSPGWPCASEPNSDRLFSLEPYGAILYGNIPDVSEDITVDCIEVTNGSQGLLVFNILGIDPLDEEFLCSGVLDVDIDGLADWFEIEAYCVVLAVYSEAEGGEAVFLAHLLQFYDY